MTRNLTDTTETRSVWDVIQECKKTFQTGNNRYEDFGLGDTVKVVVPAQDFRFYDRHNTYGRVLDNGMRYLSIRVLLVNLKTSEIGVGAFEPADLLKVEPLHDQRKEDGLRRYVTARHFFIGGGIRMMANPTLFHHNVLHIRLFESTGRSKEENAKLFYPFFRFFGIEAVVVETNKRFAALEYLFASTLLPTEKGG